ncbi:MAG: hypothetical protein ACREVQ_13165 [Burkholderiales bacterium]
MDYVWFVLAGLAVGLVMGRFLQGNNYGVPGDIAFGIIGALAFGFALIFTGIGATLGGGIKVAVAAGGALFALFLRRALGSV